MNRMRELVEVLCSERCAGRAAGSPEGAASREAIVDALAAAGCETRVQPVPGCNGANVLAALPGTVDRWVLVGAHYDHLGRKGGQVFWGANDNAAAVAVLVEVACQLARRPPQGRGVLLVAFDSEEPPYFLTPAMGAQQYCATPLVPLERTDLMVCLDLVGLSLGPAGWPSEVRQTLFALGAELTPPLGSMVDRMMDAIEGLTVRRLGHELLPPMSDHVPFERRGVPFLFLTGGRWRHYHTPYDTPGLLDYRRMEAVASWVELLVRRVCAHPEPRFESLARRDDAASLRTFIALGEALGRVLPAARRIEQTGLALLAACDAQGQLPEDRRKELRTLLELVEMAVA
jgi:hypothetical protein